MCQSSRDCQLELPSHNQALLSDAQTLPSGLLLVHVEENTARCSGAVLLGRRATRWQLRPSRQAWFAQEGPPAGLVSGAPFMASDHSKV